MADLDGVKIDHDRIGAGIYNMLTLDDQSIVSYGMIPVQIMEIATELFKKKIAAIACDKWLTPKTDRNIKLIADGINKKTISEYQHKITLSILAAAKDAGQLFV